MLTNRTNDGQTLNETDARNYAYAINTTNWQQFVGKRSAEVVNTPASEPLVKQVFISPEAE